MEALNNRGDNASARHLLPPCDISSVCVCVCVSMCACFLFFIIFLLFIVLFYYILLQFLLLFASYFRLLKVYFQQKNTCLSNQEKQMYIFISSKKVLASQLSHMWPYPLMFAKTMTQSTFTPVCSLLGPPVVSFQVFLVIWSPMSDSSVTVFVRCTDISICCFLLSAESI